MDERLDLTLFGSPEVCLAGTPLTGFRSNKARALLIYLAVIGRPLPRAVLATLLWGDASDYYARRNLNRTLSNLHQLVGDYIVVSRQTLAFDRSRPYSLDVEAFDLAVNAAPTPDRAAQLARAIQLYQGDFLDGFYIHDAPEFEQWVMGERTRLREGLIHALHELANLAAEQGDLAQAMDYARRVLGLEPWREEAHRLLIQWLAQSGQRSAALAQYEICRQTLADELNVEPDAATVALVARIRAGDFAPVSVDRQPVQIDTEEVAQATGAPLHNLPRQPTPFVGRDAEVADLARMLLEDADCRLLTLVGPGGMGKTRLALKAGERIVEVHEQYGAFAHGLFFVPLEAVEDATGIVAAIIAVIAGGRGLPLRATAPLHEQLLDFLRDKEMVLLLDNFEHLLAHVDLLSQILAAAPGVKLLVTSREAIALREAWFYPVAGLLFPPAAQEPALSGAEYDAVRFFVQCARRTQPGFSVGSEGAAIVRICQMVEGMPLAIELAAAWLKALAPQQIVNELQQGLDILTARFQDLPSRHRSIRVVLDQSWHYLSVEEREVVARLSVFRGGFSPEAAADVAGASLFGLFGLVEKAILRLRPDGRYQMHELTRQYAAEGLADTTAVALRDTHAAYYALLLHRQRAHLYSKTYKQAWAVVATEFDNVHQAWQWLIDAIDQGRADLPISALLRQMAEVLSAYYLFHTLWRSGQALLERAVEAMERAHWGAEPLDGAGQPDRIGVLLYLRILVGSFHFEMGEYRASLVVAEEVLGLCRKVGLERNLALALLLYGRTQMRRGVDTASAALEEALALFRRHEITWGRAEALISLGIVASASGAYAEAQAYLEEALALCEKMGYRPWISRTLTGLGTVFVRQNENQRALSYYEQGLAIALEEGDHRQVMINTSNVASAQRGLGRHQLSETYYEQSLALARRLGDKRWIAANLNGIAITYLEMEDLIATERSLREAVSVAHDNESIPDTLGSIALLGHVLARRGQIETALRALAFVEQHPATMMRDRAYNEPLLAGLRAELPAALFDEAAAWAAAQSLDEVVHWLAQGVTSTATH